MSRRCAGFTLIELLVALAIVAALAGLTLAAVGALQAGKKKRQSQGVCATALQALQLHGAERGGAVAPSPHPLAALAGNWDTVAAAPQAVFGDPRCPLLYGLASWRAGVLGVIPRALTGKPSDGLAADGTALAKYVLSFGNAYAELSAARALHEAPDANLIAGLGGLVVYSDDPDAASGADPTKGVAAWKAGLLQAGGPGSAWKRYRLPGLGIYDAWGREVLYMHDPSRRRALFASAGRDGCFVWKPGASGYSTPPTQAGESPLGDDAYAGQDNIVAGED